MNSFRTIYLILSLCATLSVCAQNSSYDFQYFSTEDGLSNQFVNAVFEDSRGFIWLGTNFGLNRFDGHEFKAFTAESNELVSNNIKKIYEDVNDKLWLASFQSGDKFNLVLSIFDKEKESALSFSEAFPNAPFKELEIYGIYPSSVGQKIWITTKKGGIYFYDGNFNLFAKKPEYAEVYLKDFENEKCIWLGIEKNLIQLDGEGNELKRISTPPRKVRRIGKTKDGKLWVTFHINLEIEPQLYLTNKEDQIVPFRLQNTPIPYLLLTNLYEYVDEKNQDRFLWYGVKSLRSYSSSGQLIYDFQNEILQKIPFFQAQDLIIDANQNIWVGSTNGLILISPKEQLFQTYLTDEDISTRGIASIINNELLFVATYSGFFTINRKINKVTKLDIKESSPTYGVGVAKIKNEFLIGYHGGLYFRYNFETNNMARINIYGEGINPLFFFQDNSNNIWTGSMEGLRLIDTISQKSIFPSKADQSDPIYSNTINHIREDDMGLWISTDIGFYLINSAGQVLKKNEELSGYEISFSHPSSNGNFWLTTKGKGLLHWNSKTKKIFRLTTKQGLPHNYLYSIHEDDLGMFWVPSNDGLMRFNPKDFSISTFNMSDGLPSQEFNSFSNFECEDGEIFLGTLKGLVSFNPKDFQFIDDKNQPLEIISLVKNKMNKVGFFDETKTLLAEKEITFSTDDKYLDLTFSLLGYKNSFQSKYAYKIEGYDNDWNYLNENRLRISKLPFGDYVLKIKGQGSYGKWSNSILEIPLHMEKPFYFLKWFLFSVSVLLCVIGYGFFRWRIYRLKKEKLKLERKVSDRTQELASRTEELAKLNELKDDFFAIIAHDLRAPVISFQNISNRIKYLRSQGEEKDIDEMLRMVDNAAEDLNVLLENLLNWAMVKKGVFPYNPLPLNLKKLSDETISLFKPMAKIKGIQLEQEIDISIIAKADKDAMSTILRNLISNAIKFSQTGALVKISAKKINKKIQIKIEDSGIGIPEEVKPNIFTLTKNKISRGTHGEKGSGIGLALCKHLIEINQGNIEVESELGSGSEFSVMIPSE